MRPLSHTGRSGLIRGAAAATAFASLTALVTACGTATPSAGNGTTTGHVSSSPAATHSHTVTSSPPAKHHHLTRSSATPSTGSGDLGGGSGSGGSGSGGSATAAACQSGNLGLTAAATQGTAGSFYATVTFTNRGPHSCTLYGYPGVSVGTGTPYHQVGYAAKENPSPPRELVTLPPGGVASAVLQVAEAGNYSAGQCRPRRTTELQVYPPNQTQARYTSFRATGCAGPVRLLTISVVQPGHAPQA